MKKIMIGVLCSVLLLLAAWRPAVVGAGAAEEYEEAYRTYLFSIACRGAYSDRTAKLVVRSMQREGWRVESFLRSQKDVDAKFMLAKKDVPGHGPMYLLAIAGTESKRDRQVDLSFGKVYFAGATVAEHTKNAELAEKDIPAGSPLVHRGFLKYVQAAITTADTEDGGMPLVEELLTHRDRSVYLVGHSLGGAVATLGGAYLLDMGVQPEQIKVVTFGAPPVGNDVFAAKYEPVLNLNRIVIHGDPVTSVLQNFVGGYRLFGRETNWQLTEDYVKIHHDLSLYLDYAAKQYYEKRRAARDAGVVSVPDVKTAPVGSPLVYVAPVANKLPEELSGEFSVMQDLLLDEYRDLLPGYIFDKGRTQDDDSDVTEYLQRAAEAGCQGLVIPVVTANRVKNERNTYYVTLYQRVYRVTDRTLISAATLGSNTRNMTPLEALGHGALDMTEASQEWLPLISGTGKGILQKN